MTNQRNYADHPDYEAWVEERFWRRVEKREDGCWTWGGYLGSQGYGRISYKGRPFLAHRFAYEREVGQIPEGLDIDHICGTRSCVRPSHLRAVTHRVNVLAGKTVVAREAARTECAKGHELAGDNLSVTAQGHRQCMTCARDRWARSRNARGARRARAALTRTTDTKETRP